MSNIGCNCVSARKNCRHGTLTGNDGDGATRRGSTAIPPLHASIIPLKTAHFYFTTKHRTSSTRGNNTGRIYPRVSSTDVDPISTSNTILKSIHHVCSPMYLHQSEYTRARELKLGAARTRNEIYQSIATVNRLTREGQREKPRK